MTLTLIEHYRKRVAEGQIEADAMQAAAVERFDALAEDLGRWSPGSTSLFSWMRGGKTAPPRGIYLHGAVGRGKTMIMDLFFEAAPVKRKRRLHFHEFMAEAHERIGVARKTIDGDPIPHVAREIARAARLLCFDELHVTDIADAMILGRLFRGLFEADVVIVATSNAHPSELYRHGLNRQLFMPFIDLLGERMAVVELDVEKDFRLEKLAGQKLYFVPADDAASAELDRLWENLTGSADWISTQIEVKGRKVNVPRAAMGSARFTFDDLCAVPLGPLDYLALAQAYHTIFIDGIPILTRDKRNEARRFINLIDTLYDQGVSLVASAAGEPNKIYTAGDSVDLFARTASRLIEMRSQAYLEARGERRLEDQTAASASSA